MERKQRKRPAHEESEETLRTIMRVAQRLFMEYGYRAVTTRQLAEACGLTQPALYHYFADKQDLYLAMAQEEIARLRTALEHIARRDEGVQERLEHVALYLLSSTRHDHGLMLHDIRYELAAEARATLNEVFQAGLIRPIASIFEDGLRQGLLRDRQHDGSDPITATYLFMSMISQFLTRSRDTLHPWPEGQQGGDAETAHLIVNTLLHGLVRPIQGQRKDGAQASGAPT
ncbi:MAG: TetR/AcrR family transcriptional regulator [Chloroflexota bacterium]|nr:TetR/AcrR family transcriptional regulator [Chloroflexota bacterium]